MGERPVTTTYPRRRPIWPYVGFAAFAFCLLGSVIAAVNAGDRDGKRTPDTVWVSPGPTVAPKNVKPQPTAGLQGEADPERDLGAGTPGAFCATSRLGKWFVLDGVTYVCKAPKPYRWRPVDA